MISHFQWKPLFKSRKIPGWSFSFFLHGIKYTGTYNKDGSIDWNGVQPDSSILEDITKQIHELMLFHVYE
ncbi:YheE family protein [Fredinandcohnia humi]